ncbi:MAG: potassium transporter TrkG [Bdellovibrionota bacterium]
MDIKILIKTLGGLFIILGVFLIIPGVLGPNAWGETQGVFFSVGGLTLIIGLLLWFTLRKHNVDVNHRTGFAVVSLSWLFAGLIGGLPYFISGHVSSYLDAYFESISGFTGTGSSILTSIEALPKPLLLWRSMTQWLGGMGIIVFFIAILPVMGIKGTSIFKAEVTGPSKDKITPRVRETAKKLWLLYFGYTALLAIGLAYAGMSPYDAICHSMTTLSTGGFSTRNAGIAAFNSPLIDYLIITFMILGSINFALHYRLMARRDISIFKDSEMRWYLFLTVLFTAICTYATWGAQYQSFEEAFRLSLFTVAGTASSTGFTNPDYALWAPVTQLSVLFLMVMGGSSGSTAGGVKCVRLITAAKQMSRELKQLVHPKAIFMVKSGERSIPDSVLSLIWGFLFLYLFMFSIIAIVLTFEGVEIVAAGSAALSALSNIGPGLGEVGPTGNYAHLGSTSKIILTLGMMLGRLEFYTVLVIFTPMYWRK